MRRRILIAASLAALAVLAWTSAVVQPHATLAAAGSCGEKNCPKNTHCCYSCTGNPVCVRSGIPCPECAPQ
jgi:hypothetical protein